MVAPNSIQTSSKKISVWPKTAMEHLGELRVPPACFDRSLVPASRSFSKNCLTGSAWTSWRTLLRPRGSRSGDSAMRGLPGDPARALHMHMTLQMRQHVMGSRPLYSRRSVERHLASASQTQRRRVKRRHTDRPPSSRSFPSPVERHQLQVDHSQAVQTRVALLQ